MIANQSYCCLVLLLLLAVCTYSKIFHTLQSIRKITKNDGNGRRKILKLRAGATIENNDTEDHKPYTVIVSTLFGSEFLDKKKKFVVRNTTTISELKEQIQNKFPGSPPKEIQRIFLGTERLLIDEDVLGNITSTAQVTLLLDMTSGTSVYNKTMSVRQTLDAYVASTTQQAFISSAMKNLINQLPPSQNSSVLTAMETSQLRNLYRTINQTIYENHQDEISKALEIEKNPEYDSDDTKPWRGKKKNNLSPLLTAVAKEFDMNSKGLVNFAYYSIILTVFAYFGSPTPQSTMILLAMVPFLWISKLRQVRFLFKIITNTILPISTKIDYFLKLLPAPYQVIAEYTRPWLSSSDDDEDSIESDEALDASQKDTEEEDDSEEVFADKDNDDEDDDSEEEDDEQDDE